MRTQLQPCTTTHGRASRTLLLVMAGFIVLAGAGFLLVQLVLHSSSLHGRTVHDFGLVEITGESAHFTHTFVLTNQASEPIHIDGLRRSCGCAEATYRPDVVKPGEELHITVTLTLAQSGFRDANVEVLTDGDHGRTLYVKATGRRAPGMWVPRTPVRISANQRATQIQVLATTATENTPPSDPAVEVPEHFTIGEIGAWQLRSTPSRSEATALWGLTIPLHYDTLPGGDPGTVSITANIDGMPISVAVSLHIVDRPTASSSGRAVNSEEGNDQPESNDR